MALTLVIRIKCRAKDMVREKRNSNILFNATFSIVNHLVKRLRVYGVILKPCLMMFEPKTLKPKHTSLHLLQS